VSVLFHAYDIFIKNFSPQYQGLVSLGLLAVIILSVYQAIRKSLIWIFLLVLFVPASIPILSNIGRSLLLFLQYIVTHALGR